MSHKNMKARCRAAVLGLGLMLFSAAQVHAVTLQEALTSANYAVFSCDINNDGQSDYLIKSVAKMVPLPLDDDLIIPIVLPPKGPTFLIKSFGDVIFSLIQNPDATVQGYTCWTPATYGAKAGDGTSAPIGTLYVYPTQGAGPGFVVGINAGTNTLELAGIRRPPVMTDPSTPSAPSGSIPVTATAQTRTTTYEYDAATGLLRKQILEPDNSQLRVEVSVSYDDWGNVSTTSISSPAGGNAAVAPRTMTSRYDARGQFLLSTTNAEGHTDKLEYDSRYGTPRTYSDPNGATAKWEYDSFGRVSRAVAADGTAINVEYAYCSGTVVCPGRAKYRITHTPVNAGGGVNGPWTREYFDELDRSVAVDTPGFDAGSVISTTQVYDDLGRVRQTTRPAFQGQSQAVTTYAYDILGRPVSMTGPDGAVSSIEYSGLQTVVRDPLNKARTSIKDSQGRLAKVIDPVGATLTYAYDPFGNLSQVTDSANITTQMSYDIRGNKLAMLAPNLGYWQYEYDAFGQPIRQTDGRGQVSSFTYDRLGRMMSSIEPDLTANWTYDNCTKGIGSLCKDSSPSGFERTYSYDTLGRLNGTLVTIDNVGYATLFGYDADGRIATLSYPNGFGVRYVYSGLGDLAEIRNNASNALYWQAGQRDALGRLTSQRFGNGLVTGQEFEPLSGRIKNIFAGANKSVQDLNYQFDLGGNLLSRKDATRSISESFAFDSAGRLTDAQLSSPAVTTRQNFAYDATGNVLSRSDLGSYTYGSALHPHAVTSVAMPDGRHRNYTYDAVGNVTRIQQVDSQGIEVLKDSLALTYTSFNSVRSIVDGTGTNTLGLAYGANHERIMQQSTEGLRVYVHHDNAGGLLYEKLVKPDGAVEHNYFVAAEGQTVAVIKQEGSTLTPVYTHQDYLGSTIVVTDANGAVDERLSYDVFGKRRFSNGALDSGNTIQGASTKRGYTFHEHADSFGLINMNGRFYDPAIGRFLAADPGVPHENDPQSFNRYAYGRNNPLLNVDPNGFEDTSTPTVVVTSSRQENGNEIRDSFMFDWIFTVHYEIREGLLQTVFVNGTKQFANSTKSKNYDTISHVMGNGLAAGKTLSSSRRNEDKPLNKIRRTIGNHLDYSWSAAKASFKYHVDNPIEIIGDTLEPFGGASGPKAFLGLGSKLLKTASVTKKISDACCCFPAGTPVVTEDGMVSIETIQVGQLVYARNPETGETALKPVTAVIKTPEKPLFKLVTENSVGSLEAMEVTGDHPYWVEKRGWVNVEELVNGMTLQDLNGMHLQVISVEKVGRSEVTFNLTVADFHTYFAGNQKVLVHNCTCSLAAKALGKLSIYPKVIDPRTGRTIPFPSNIAGKVSASNRVSWGSAERGHFIAEWYRRGFATPKGGWGVYDIHHIQPREFGGGNEFWNLVPVLRETHQQLFNSYWSGFKGL